MKHNNLIKKTTYNSKIETVKFSHLAKIHNERLFFFKLSFRKETFKI
jgi:hypothetical protein